MAKNRWRRNINIKKPAQLGVDLALWVLSFGVICGSFHTFITRENYITAIFYFLILSLLVIWRYKHSFTTLIQKASKRQTRLLIWLLILHVGTYYIAHTILGRPPKNLTQNTTSFLEMNHYFLLAKPLEVILQQAFVIALIFILQKHNIKFTNAIIIIFLLFGGMHMFLFLSLDPALALYFTFFALCASFLFTLLITKLKNGFLYSFIVHMMFYQISALVFWSLL